MMFLKPDIVNTFDFFHYFWASAFLKYDADTFSPLFHSSLIMFVCQTLFYLCLIGVYENPCKVQGYLL